MVILTKEEAYKVIKELSKSKNREIIKIVNKLKNPIKLNYVRGSSNIRKLLRQALEEKKKVKIRYYSPNSDEHTTRVIDIYKLYINSVIAFCHLREEERTFAVERINSASLLNEKYTIPKNWNPENIILKK